MAGAGEAIKSVVSKGASSGAAPEADAATSAVKGAVIGGAAAVTSTAVNQVTGAAKNISFLMVILGIVHYIFRVIGASPTIVFSFSLLLFVLSGYALASKTGKDRITILIPMFAFVLWYFVFGRNYDPVFLMYFISIFSVVFILPIVLTKGKSLLPELVGFIPVLFLFLDVGLIAFLVENFGLPVTPFMENLVLFMPWWAFLGLLTLPSEASKNDKLNAMINIVKILGVLYIIFVLIAPAIPNVAFSKMTATEIGQMEDAQQRLKESLPDKENPAYSNFVCVFSEPTNVPTCVEKRQTDAKLKTICLNEEDDRPLEDCMEEQRKLKADKSLQVAGTIDSTIKQPTKAELVIDKKLFPTDYNPQGQYPFELKIENPRKESFTAKLSCNFTGKGVKDVAGVINNNEIPISDEYFETTSLCSPKSELKGTYELHFNVDFINLKTTSRLTRAFIGLKTPKEKEKLRNEEISKVIPLAVSQAPKEFARINFDLGHATNEIIIEDNKYKNIVLRSNIENTGIGAITNIKQYAILLFMDTDNPYCLEGPREPLKEKKKSIGIPLPSCIVQYPSEYMGIEDWVQKEFEAELVYDYQITKKESITVTKDDEK